MKISMGFHCGIGFVLDCVCAGRFDASIPAGFTGVLCVSIKRKW